MPYCRGCGYKCEDGDEFCGECGLKLNTSKEILSQPKEDTDNLLNRFGPLNKNRFFRCLWVSIIITDIVVLLSLLSYTPYDIRFETSTPNLHIKNIFGIPGAYLSWFLFKLLGITVYIIPIFILFYAGFKLKGRKLPRPTKFIITTILLLILIYALVLTDSVRIISITGIVGYWLKSFLSGYIGKVGSFLIIIAVFVISLISYIQNRPFFKIFVKKDRML